MTTSKLYQVDTEILQPENFPRNEYEHYTNKKQLQDYLSLQQATQGSFSIIHSLPATAFYQFIGPFEPGYFVEMPLIKSLGVVLIFP